MKRVMEKMGIIRIVKKSVISDVRSRRYIPDGTRRKNGYTWLRTALATSWTLTDQINVNQKIYANETENKSLQAVAA